MLSFLAGLRVGEIAALKVSDVVDGEGRARDQLRLNPAYTKGGVSRTIFVNKQLQRDICRYLDSLPAFPAPESALLPSQKGQVRELLDKLLAVGFFEDCLARPVWALYSWSRFSLSAAI